MISTVCTHRQLSARAPHVAAFSFPRHSFMLVPSAGCAQVLGERRDVRAWQGRQRRQGAGGGKLGARPACLPVHRTPRPGPAPADGVCRASGTASLGTSPDCRAVLTALPAWARALTAGQSSRHLMGQPRSPAPAGGVAVSGLEMSQNRLGLSWTRQEVQERLQRIMRDIYDASKAAADEYQVDLAGGANIAGFLKVSPRRKHPQHCDLRGRHSAAREIPPQGRACSAGKRCRLEEGTSCMVAALPAQAARR